MEEGRGEGDSREERDFYTLTVCSGQQLDGRGQMVTWALGSVVSDPEW